MSKGPQLRPDEFARGFRLLEEAVRREFYEYAEMVTRQICHLVNWHWECGPQCAGEIHGEYIEVMGGDVGDVTGGWRAHIATEAGAAYVGHEPVPLREESGKVRMHQYIALDRDDAAVGVSPLVPEEGVDHGSLSGYLVYFTTGADLAKLRAAVLVGASGLTETPAPAPGGSGGPVLH